MRYSDCNEEKLHYYHSERRFLQQQSVDDGHNATDVMVSKGIKRSKQKNISNVGKHFRILSSDPKCKNVLKVYKIILMWMKMLMRIFITA